MTISNPYSEQAIANYNDNPPPNDGTQVAANLVDWDKIKDELGDPIKTLSENIDNAINAAFVTLVGKIGFQILNKAVDYTIVAGDVDENLILTADTSSGNVTITLPAAASYSGSEIMVVKTNASNTLTVKDSGATTVATITANQAYYRTISDGTNEYEVPQSKLVQVAQDQSATEVTSTLQIPHDDTVPLISEGTDSGLSVSITPNSSSNLLYFNFDPGKIHISGGTAVGAFIGVFQDSVCVLAREYTGFGGPLSGYVTAGGTAAQTWTVRFGFSAGSGPTTVYMLNGPNGSKFGAAEQMSLRIMEVSP